MAGDEQARFAGRRALVTGGSRGIGAAIAEALAAEGADVAITARTLEPDAAGLPGSLREVGARLEAHGARVGLVQADIANESDRDRIVPEAVDALGGPIDILVNDAAAGEYQMLAQYELRHARQAFEVNVIGPFHLSQAVLPAMLERGEGWIVNVSSRTAQPGEGPPFSERLASTAVGMYGASKAALNRLSNALAGEVWGKGIRVNTVEPRIAVLTPGAEWLVGEILLPHEVEPMSTMVAATLTLCDCPPDMTGQSWVSLDLLTHLGLKG